MFTESQKSTFPYYFAHVCAYNMTALNLGVWKPKYIFHDWEKPWMLLLAKGLKKIGILKCEPYEWVRDWHRTHRKHHVQYYKAPTLHKNGRMPNVIEMIIDQECSRLTKESSPLNAYQYFQTKKDKMPELVRYWFEVELKHLGLWES
ncbi:MAG: hypothetical protein HDS66_01010 [Bacteroidales bacterium]|nr:hypothetical protein [Bacteroidales bacterium]